MGSQSEAAGSSRARDIIQDVWLQLEVAPDPLADGHEVPAPRLRGAKTLRDGERLSGRRDLDKAREDLLLSTEVQSPHLLKDNFFKVDFYKPVVASKTSKVGGTYRANTIGRIGFFMHH